jgi:hypothetical protein
MRRVEYCCDRCGETIEAGRALVVVQAGNAPPSWPTDPESGRPSADLCPGCLADLTGWLATPRPSGPSAPCLPVQAPD